MVYASRTYPLSCLPPDHPPAPTPSSSSYYSANQQPSRSIHSRENSVSTNNSYQSRALPPSFSESYSPHVDKRAAQRHEPRLTNPNEIGNVRGHYFPSVPKAGPRPSIDGGRALPRDYIDDEPVRSLGHSPQKSFASITSTQGPGEERMEVDGEDEDGTGEPSKKRSRTLTTAHQTAVLNALLSKVSLFAPHSKMCTDALRQTRFPSTETRAEVGQQIGMSARRVQIWFQNVRSSFSLSCTLN